MDFTALKTAIQNAVKLNGNEEITGDILQGVLLSMVTTLGDSAINDLVTTISNEATARQNGDSTLNGYITALQGAVNSINTAIENGFVYAGIATPTTTPATGKVFYLALTAGTYNNYLDSSSQPLVLTQGINILKFNGTSWSVEQVWGVDDAPTPSSNNLVKSGGVFDKVMTDGSAFDISAHFASGGTLATYADLSAALTALNTLSASYKRGGMSIKFVQTSDNKYVRYNLIADEFTTDISKWAVGDGGVYIDNSEYYKIETDNEGKIYEGIKTDGTKEVNLPTKFKEDVEVEGLIINQKLQEQFETKANTTDVEAEFGTKLDKINSTTNVDNEETLSFFKPIENPEWLKVHTDSEGKIYEGIKKSGITKHMLPHEFTEVIANTVSANALSLSEEGLDSLANELKNTGIIGGQTFYLKNPYEGASFDNRVAAQSHEHCYSKALIESAYNRGIRVISCSHYYPSAPRWPLSNHSYTYKDVKSYEAAEQGDYEMIDRVFEGQIPTITIDGNNIDTDTLPQIANAERGFTKDSQGNLLGHLNILGLLWATAGNSMANYDGQHNKNPYRSICSLESLEKYNQLLLDSNMWQFGARYAFGTINHTSNVTEIKEILDTCPNIFKAMEMFNDNYSLGTNENFRDAYDSILRQGYKIWATAVADHQGTSAPWKNNTNAEKAAWQAKYDALPSEEKEQYADAEAYYRATYPFFYDKGCNVLLMDNSFDSMTASEKSKEAIKAYLDGRYYMSASNTKGMKVTCNGNLVSFKVSDFADRLNVITANGKTSYTNTDSIDYIARANDKYIRFEAFWEDDNQGYYEFVLTNPVWVETIE